MRLFLISQNSIDRPYTYGKDLNSKCKDLVLEKYVNLYIFGKYSDNSVEIVAVPGWGLSRDDLNIIGDVNREDPYYDEAFKIWITQQEFPDIDSSEMNFEWISEMMNNFDTQYLGYIDNIEYF